MKITSDFQDLYEKYVSDIFRYALFLCGDKTEAEDMTSETFTRALTGKSPIVTSTAKGFLLTIARNLYLESLRNRKKNIEISFEIPDSESNLENALFHKDELEDLKIYLQKFPEVDRSAVLLRAEGLRYNEIAMALEITQVSAKVKVHRMRLKLAEWRTNR